jgi:hypothetical protein
VSLDNQGLVILLKPEGNFAISVALKGQDRVAALHGRCFNPDFKTGQIIEIGFTRRKRRGADDASIATKLQPVLLTEPFDIILWSVKGPEARNQDRHEKADTNRPNDRNTNSITLLLIPDHDLR